MLEQLVIIGDMLQIQSNEMQSRDADHPRLFFVSNIDGYKQLHRPVISQSKKEHIEAKLKLENQAHHQLKERQIQLDYYLKYDYNPFMAYRSSLKPKQKGNNVSLVDKLTEIGNKEKNYDGICLKQRNNLQMMKMNSAMFSKKLISNVENKNYVNSLPTEAGVEKQTKNLDWKQAVNFSGTEIEAIAEQQEENYFAKNSKKINIFLIRRGESDEISNKDILDQNRFCFNSVIQKISKWKVPIYRDLSLAARYLIVGRRPAKFDVTDYVDSFELSFKMKNLLFQDLMSVASGRFSTEFLNKLLNSTEGMTGGRDSNSDNSSEESIEQQIFYRQNKETNASMNFKNLNEEVEEIKDYKLLEYNEAEKSYDNICERKKNNLIRNLQTKEHLYKNTINDQKLHNNISEDVLEKLVLFVEMDKNNLESDRLVRINKTHKDRREVIKIKKIMETLAAKNRHDRITKKQQN